MAANESSFLTDEELVHRYRNSHDTAYIGELYVRYTHLVFAVCIKYLHNESDAEDATMQIFEKLIQDLKKHHVLVFKPWLHTVVKNHCMMHFRKTSQTQRKENELKISVKGSVENPEENHLETEAEREAIVKYLNGGIETLSEQQRSCVELFYLKDKSYQQISDETGYSMNDVKSYIQNGKRNLKNYIVKSQAANNAQPTTDN